MKVLVVDDEYYARKAVIKMLDDKYANIVTSEEAENGAEAIESINKEVPDIVLTDVRMPEIDGLELAKYISDNDLKCSVIVISGFADFEYARKAIKYEVDDYILKPVKRENLFEVIDKVLEKINKTLNMEKNETILKNRLSEADKELTENKLNEIVREQSDTSFISCLKLLRLDKESLSYKVFVLLQKYRFNESDKAELRSKFEKENGGLIYTFFNNVQKNELVILCIGMEDKKKFEYEVLPKQFYYIKEFFYLLDKENFVMGASSIYSCSSPLSIAYEEAERSALTYLVSGWGKIYDFEKVKGFWLKERYPYQEELRILKHLLEEAKEDQAINIVKKIFLNIKEAKTMSLMHLNETCMKLSAMITDLLSFTISNDNSLEVSPFKQIDLSNFSDIDAIENYYKDLIKKICRAHNHKKDYDQTALVGELKKYLMEHYYEDISLEEIAREKYYMNFSYLSRIFKTETGETFSNALLKIRMEKAKQLLEDTDIPITQIALLTGYNNAAYFVKTFKKYYGETPGYYKKNK